MEVLRRGSDWVTHYSIVADVVVVLAIPVLCKLRSLPHPSGGHTLLLWLCAVSWCMFSSHLLQLPLHRSCVKMLCVDSCCIYI